jgi:hypothetical protein
MYATSRVLAGLDFFGRTEVLLVIQLAKHIHQSAQLTELGLSVK